MKTIIQIIEECNEKNKSLHQMISVKDNERRISEIDELMSGVSFWSDQKKAAVLTKERQSIVSLLDSLKKIDEQSKFLAECVKELPGEVEYLESQSNELYEIINSFEIAQMLDGENDNSAAIISISAGAGGTESANFCHMLFRMLLRYCDKRGWKVEILDEQPSAEYSHICLDGVSFQASGEYAYGYLKNLHGIIRLIRNSPFNAADARHTSFAAISVIPDIDDKIDIEIKDSDIEISYTRSQGAGGQSVNTSDSCCRLKHLPSGISIRSQSERSAHENKRIAFKILKAKLYDIELKKKEAEKDKLLNAQSNVAFGSQAITITMSNYNLVKDHRTGFESTQVDAYLDGDIHAFIIEALRRKI